VVGGTPRVPSVGPGVESGSSGSRHGGGSGGLTCGEAAETARRWHAWRSGGRSAFAAQRSSDLVAAQKKFDAATASAMSR
jgi:hypothetical protein